MTTERKDGGPAFAALAVSAVGDVYEQTGLSLRDWFAGQALAGLIASPDFISPSGLFTGNGAPVMADAAYILADAMIEQGSKP